MFVKKTAVLVTTFINRNSSKLGKSQFVHRIALIARPQVMCLQEPPDSGRVTEGKRNFPKLPKIQLDLFHNSKLHLLDLER